jgi:hypothetical protein
MRLIRALLAPGILYLADCLNAIARWILYPGSASRAPMHPVEQILLGSIVGLGLSVLWIWIGATAAGWGHP